MTGLREWGRDVGYAALCAAAVLGCLLVTADDLRADTGQTCQDSCAAQGLTGQSYGTCVSQCCNANPSACNTLTACSGGTTPTCSTNGTQNLCEAVNTACLAGSAECNCRWHALTPPNTPGCKCTDINGGWPGKPPA